MAFFTFLHEYGAIVLLLLTFAVIIGIIIRNEIWYRKHNTCKHGIYNPRKIKKDGSWKCQKCYNEYLKAECEKEEAKIREERKKREEEKKKREEERLKKEREEYKKEYCRISKSVRAELCSTMLTTISGIRRQNPYEFEDFCAHVYKKNGYIVTQTPYSNDGGKDAIAIKDGKKTLIECKHWAEERTIRRPDLQKFYAAMKEEEANEGHYIATCGFTKEAKEYAEKFNIKLIDMKELSYIAGIKTNNEVVFSFSVPCLTCGTMVSFKSVGDKSRKMCANGHLVNNPAVDPMEPRCPFCDSKLKCIEIVYKNYPNKNKRIRYYGCGNYPNCNYKIGIDEYNKEKELLMDGKC